MFPPIEMFMRRVWLPVMLGVMMFGLGCTATPSVEDGTLYDTLRRASASVLKDGRVAGSGSFIDAQGTFLTAAHVVHQPEDRIELLLHDGTELPCVVVARDLGADIVILQRVDADGQPAPTPAGWLDLADTAPPAGASVFVYGAPAMYRDLMLPGRIAADAPRYNHQGANDCYLHSLNLAGPTPPGISGGNWVNAHGRLVGVQCSHIGSESATTGMAFIAPLEDIRRLVAARVDQPASTIGAQVVTLWSQAFGYTRRFPEGTVGVALHRIKDAGPVADAEMPKDIVITHVNGTATPDTNAFMDAVRAHAPGDTIDLATIAPDSHERKTYTITLAELKW